MKNRNEPDKEPSPSRAGRSQKEINRKNKIYSEVAGKVLSVLSEEQRKYGLHHIEISGILHFVEKYITRDKKTANINIINIKSMKSAVDKFTDYLTNIGKGG